MIVADDDREIELSAEEVQLLMEALEDVRQGRTRPLNEVQRELERKT